MDMNFGQSAFGDPTLENDTIDTSNKLEPLKPVPVIEEASEAEKLAPQVPESRKSEIAARADQVVDEIFSKNQFGSPEFRSDVETFSKIGQENINTARTFGNAILEKKSSSLNGAKKSGDTNSENVSKALMDLRHLADDLSPSNQKSGPKWLPSIFKGNQVDRYFQKYQSSQSHINAIAQSLEGGREELLKDIATLRQETKRRYDNMGRLNENITTARALKQAVSGKALEARQNGNEEMARKIEDEVLYYLTQREMDLTTQMAVAVQGYMSHNLIIKNNQELVKGVERALNTTMEALEVAVTTSVALGEQKLVLDKIDAVNKATDSLIMENSRLLADNSVRIHRQASSSGVSMETLNAAFENIYKAIDEVSNYKQESIVAMDQSIESVRKVLDKAAKRTVGMSELESTEGDSVREQMKQLGAG